MSADVLPTVSPTHRAGRSAELDERPPGERYYRHPGDVVRLVLWGSATARAGRSSSRSATATSDGVTRRPRAGRRPPCPTAVRQLLLVLVQVAAVVVPSPSSWSLVVAAPLAAAG